MSLFGSLFAGVSGLSAQSRAMGMISDNIANVNTTAYKGASAQFSNLVTRQLSTATYSAGGVRAQTLYNIGGQGLVQGTASPTDAAISGAGFFVVNSLADGEGEQVYTRAGAFQADFEGNLKTPSGHFLQGWALDGFEQIADLNQLETINIRNINGLATPTTAVRLGANLNANTDVYAGPPAYAVGEMALWRASNNVNGIRPDFTQPVSIYDSLGRQHDVKVSFLRTGPNNTWSVEVTADPADVDVGVHPDGLLASGTVSFNGDGSLQAVAITPVVANQVGEPIEIQWDAAGGSDPSTITFDFGTIGELDGLSQFASSTKDVFVHQDGSGVGDLIGVSIDDDGFVVAAFTSGEERRIYQLPIATFANPGALDPRSGNVFAQTDASGDFSLRIPGTGGAGLVTPSSLEAANVDLAEEFTKMIVTQRAYSANAKVINTTDQMLDELIRIAR